MNFKRTKTSFLRRPKDLCRLISSNALFLRVYVQVRSRPIRRREFYVNEDNRISISSRFFVQLLVLYLRRFRERVFPILLWNKRRPQGTTLRFFRSYRTRVTSDSVKAQI